MYIPMSKLNTPKKASPQDWHPADIVAGLRKAGWSLRKLSAHHRYAETTLKQALAKPWPKGEKLIAEAMGVKPWDIWPGRYAVSIDADGHEIGVPNRGLPGRKAGVVYDTASTKNCNVNRRRVA